MMLPKEESKKRVERVQGLLKDKGLECALVYYDERVETGYQVTASGPVPFSPTMEKHILGYRM
jgi:hypothetical protein